MNGFPTKKSPPDALPLNTGWPLKALEFNAIQSLGIQLPFELTASTTLKNAPTQVTIHSKSYNTPFPLKADPPLIFVVLFVFWGTTVRKHGAILPISADV